MTCIVWDGEVLASDSYLFRNRVITEKNFNKIWFVNEFVFSVSGLLSDYHSIKEQLSQVDDLEDLLSISVNDDTHAIIFDKKTPVQYYEHDGNHIIINPIDEWATLGGTEEYALALIHYGLTSERIVKQCIDNHKYAGGNINKVNIGEYFGWA